MNRSLSLFIILFLGSAGLYAQPSVWEGGKEQWHKAEAKKSAQTNRIKGLKTQLQQWGLDTQYRHALAVSARLHTNGWSGGFIYQQAKTQGRRSVWQLHFSEIRHEKETQQQLSGNPFPLLGKPKPFVFGKVNKLYTLQLGYGGEQVVFPALLNGNMSIGLRYSGGLALALLKPYYLDLIYVDYLPEPVAYLKTEKYSLQNQEQFLRQGAVLKSATWTTGLNETQLRPGLFAELSVVLEPDKPQGFIKTITIGGNAALYSSKLQIMALQKAYPYQLSFFVGLALGKRW